MISTHCPACSGPLRWHEDTARSLVGELPQGEQPRTLPDLLDEHTVGALRAAIRALEDAAAGVRWRMARADAPLRLDEELVRLEQDVAVLHALTRPQARAVPAPAPGQQRVRTATKAVAPSPARLPRAEVA